MRDQEQRVDERCVKRLVPPDRPRSAITAILAGGALSCLALSFVAVSPAAACNPSIDPSCSPDATVYYDDDEPDDAFSRTDAIEPAVDGFGTNADGVEEDGDDLQRQIAGRLVLATDALAELGAFERDEDPEINNLIADLARTVPSGGLEEIDYINELADLSFEFSDLVAELGPRANGDALTEIVSMFDENVVERIAMGETAFVEPLPWLESIADVLVRSGATLEDDSDEALDADVDAVLEFVELFGDPDAFLIEEPETAPVVATTTTTTTQAPDLALVAETDGISPLVIGGLIAAIAVVIGGLLAGGRKKKSDDSEIDREDATATESGPVDRNGAPAIRTTLPIAPPKEEPGSLIELLDVSRRMTAALDTNEVAAIAIAEARTLVDAEGGLLIRRTTDGLVPIASNPSALFSSENLRASVLRRVVETGRSESSVTSEDAALVDVPAAMAAVAVVADSTVIGALLVVRRPTRQFNPTELDALQMLAPLVGSALIAAETHGSATALADLDALTGLANRRSLDRDIEALHPNHVASYVMIDVDHFKNFNDTNGHAAGDMALQTVARAIETNVRPEDRAYRYGGEEFCVLLPGANATDAALVAERVRAAVEASTIPGGEHQPGGRVTISIGVADTSAGTSGIIERADGALYEAKESGRNRVNIAG